MFSSYRRSGGSRSLFFLLLLGLVIVFFLSGCSPRKESKATSDELRIVSLSPAATSILLNLSLAKNLAGIDCWSAPLAGIPEGLPSFDMIHPDAERIMALAPDIIFVSSMTRDATGRDPLEPFSKSGVTVHYIPVSENIEAIKRDVRFIAEICGVKDSGEAVVRTMENAFTRVEKVTAEIPENQRKRVYFEIGAGSTLYSFGNGVYLDELLRKAGGINIFSGQSGWLVVNAEQVLARNPEVILTNVPDKDAATRIVERPGWNSLTAVRTRQVYRINHEKSSQPAPSIVHALDEIVRSLYPVLFTGDQR